MSKQLLLVRVSVDRVGQRTTEHNRSSSPPDSRRLTEYNGVAKAKGWKISFPRNRVGKFRFWQRAARWTRENEVGCTQRRHGIGTTRRHLQELQQKVGVLDLGDQDSTNRQTRPRPGARPRGRAGLVRHWGSAPVARVWNRVVSGTPLLRYISRLYYMQNLASFP